MEYENEFHTNDEIQTTPYILESTEYKRATKYREASPDSSEKKKNPEVI